MVPRATMNRQIMLRWSPYCGTASTFQIEGVESMRPFTISRVLVLIAVILFVLAALRLAVPLPVELVAAGLAFWAASQLV